MEYPIQFTNFTQKGVFGFVEEPKATSLQTRFTLVVGAVTQFSMFGRRLTFILKNSCIA